MDLLEKYRLDRTKIQVMTVKEMHADNSDLEFWRSKSLDERIEAMELLRQINYGYDAATSRLQRVLEIAELEIS
ncbi:hypothetical protein B1R32_108176 [Abditibacterium utsteinense]|uniref:Uncharacterized protein n=1 Tax=Abditibacterium utsteinense TaxID=1960156 RepID=A0A2S8ST37_9BACT|nr:hypothetical protein [Abditibacterium utsteinense]PQV63965.1 hypothetical protein B1R32_108176 [Abditibacterium utsteinense]